MKRIICVILLAALFTSGCAQKNPLDLTPDEFIKQFNSMYAEEFPQKEAIEIEPLSENGITTYRYKISNQSGFMFTTNDKGNIEIGVISSSAPLELIAMQLLSYKILHGKEGGLEVYYAILEKAENDPLIYDKVTHARLPNDGNFQCVGFSR
ncbi:MAG TPA: hypothetical protein PKB13_08400 [Clostridia bacterium]|nr:hypothetical protein [Clostridia bacterium]